MKVLPLSEIPTGSRCVIVKVRGHGGFRHRILEMGFVKGETVKVLKNAPLLDPIEYEIMGIHISLRRSEAANVWVVAIDDSYVPEDSTYQGTFEEATVFKTIESLSKEITVALVGNPNCGKTSFFNLVTGSREKVGNYSGVTVDAKMATINHKGYTIHFVDLPGTYSLTEYSPEELYVRSFLFNEHPDVVLNIVDSGHLERNLFLTTQLIDINPRMVMALNMFDELEREGFKLDVSELSTMLGFPIIPTIATIGKGLEEVLDSIVKVSINERGNIKHIHINYGEEMESSIRKVRNEVEQNHSIKDRYHGRYIALKLIENDSVIHNEISNLPNYSVIKRIADDCRSDIESSYHDDISTVVSDLKYGFIRGALKETLSHIETGKHHFYYSLDKVLTNKWLGFPTLILFMWIMFQTTFTVGAYPQAWLEAGVEWLSDIVRQLLPAGIINDLVVDGIISGVGGVLVFLPNILILFLFISFMEDSGYMARAAFIMDKLMHKIGLHGQSFIPYIIGFGCSVPAIMATRTLENKKDRILTIFTIPFLSCSARLPVYLLFIAAFFTAHQGLVLMSIYLLGILMAIFTALMSKMIYKKNISDHFVMELPPYRIPTLRNMIIHMWDKSVMYIKKMGSVILLAAIIIWALGYFPRNVRGQENLSNAEKKAAQIENSYIGHIGHAIEPIMRPIGFDWKMSVSLISGLAAKEVVVSTLGILYQGDSDSSSQSLAKVIASQTDEMGNPFFTPVKAYAYMIFVLLYMPCVAAVSAIGKEAGRKWAWLSVVYTILSAWLFSFIIFQIGNLFL